MSHHRAPSIDTVAGRALDRDGFAAHVRQQISAAKQLLARHQATGCGCACGRPLPCPQRQSLNDSREHYQTKLALLDTTAVLPIVAPTTTTASRRGRWLRNLFGILGGQA